MPEENGAASRLRIVIVSGLSGAGKTIALRALEDAGFFCIDNLPVTLIDSFLGSMQAEGNFQGLGIGVDIREKRYLADAYAIISTLKQHYAVEVLFLEAEKDVMTRRFKETRRPHPMVPQQGGMTLDKAIAAEKLQLAPIREIADRIIDTSGTTPHQLRQQLMSIYGKAFDRRAMQITLLTFGYKFGVPQNADLLFDVRFLPNPFFVPALKDLTGLDKEVIDYVMAARETGALISKLADLLDFVIPQYRNEGRAYLVIGIGCTGGHHRSPVVARAIAGHLKADQDIDAEIVHRDLAH
jgi:UPF0042 nucleotide-binding protein